MLPVAPGEKEEAEQVADVVEWRWVTNTAARLSRSMPDCTNLSSVR